MDHIMHSLEALNGILVDRQFMCGEHVTVMDVVMYNELSQTLFMNNLFLKNS